MPDAEPSVDVAGGRPDGSEGDGAVPSDPGPPVEDALSDPTGLHALVAKSRERVSVGQAQANELLEKYHDRVLLDLGLRIYQRDRESAGTIVGSALAFRLFLFFVPLLLFVVGLFGFLASWSGPDDVTEATGVTGTLAVQINTALTQPDSTRWVATFAGLFGMAWAGRSLSKVMVTAACLTWRLPVTTKAPLRLVGGVVGLVVGMGFVSTIVNRVRIDLGLGAASLSFIAAFAVYASAWMAMSLLLPRATTDPGALLPGAALIGVTIAGMQAVSQLYLPDKLDRASQLYGAIGTTIVTLGWFFFLGRAMVLSMSLDAVIYERFGSISQLVFSLPIVRVLPRKSPWARKFFDLEEEVAGSPRAGERRQR